MIYAYLLRRIIFSVIYGVVRYWECLGLPGPRGLTATLYTYCSSLQRVNARVCATDMHDLGLIVLGHAVSVSVKCQSCSDSQCQCQSVNFCLAWFGLV